LGILHQLSSAAAKCADVSVWALSDTDLGAAVEHVHRLEQTIAAVKLHLIGELDGRDLPTRQSVRDTVTWLRLRLLLDAGTARHLVEQAGTLRRHPAVDAALTAGTIHLRQADAITAALDALPTASELATVPAIAADDPAWAIVVSATGSSSPAGAVVAAEMPGARMPNDAEMTGAGMLSAEMPEAEMPGAADVAARAEAALLGFADDFAPSQLRRLGNRILDHVAPELADRLDAIALEREERRAWRERGLTLSPPAGGLVRVHGHLTVEDAGVVSAALDPLSGPGVDADSRNPAQVRADALVEVCRLALRTGELPDNGGEPPQLAVTVAYDPLTRRLGVGQVDSGDRISPTVARRLACDAQILPVVLSGTGQVLDAGRARRLATGPLRRALVVRDRGCSFPDCDRPPRWCDAHHVRSWMAGGPTNLGNLVLLCRRHHRLIHDGDWTVQIAADGLPEFIGPPVLGAPRRPRRNRFHRRT
jgi:hypothetical protein